MDGHPQKADKLSTVSGKEGMDEGGFKDSCLKTGSRQLEESPATIAIHSLSLYPAPEMMSGKDGQTARMSFCVFQNVPLCRRQLLLNSQRPGP
jgi:hypothetical protein